ncbi:Calcium-dependent lipid-binding (CaLB domain) family protein [Theobroma cacao]|uniref:Calcium-dependent lipid-binding (CaLB domain) family protein n=1 Tax=Theobroma cacao TaxID=3641 RepID=A0A061ECD0_THECC|nr:Calcium-dependent lipid-binding (CaLB domain) family protein [Theobroma cacao]
MEKTSLVLELNFISAQGLVHPSLIPDRHLKTYAVAWVDSSTKLHTRVDRVGGENPTWNDKFLFKVSPEFLFNKTSTVSVEIYAAGTFRDRLIGSVRLLIHNFIPTASAAAMKTPAFAALLIHSPFGQFFGTLNVGGMVLDGSRFQLALSKVSTIDYRDLTGENRNGKHHLVRNESKASFRDIMESTPSERGDLSKTEEKEEVATRKLEQPLAAIDLLPRKAAEEMISDNEGSMVKMEKDVKMIVEENKKPREMVQTLVVEAKGQSTVKSDLTGRVKNLEKKLSRRNKQRKLHYGRTARAPKFNDAA